MKLSDEFISARHVIIAADGRDFHVLDQRSSSGTFLNGERIGQAKLRHGDIIELGRQGPGFRVEIIGGSSEHLDASDVSAIRSGSATDRYYAQPTTRLGLHDAPKNIGLFNPFYDDVISKRSPGIGIIWAVFMVMGLLVIGLTMLDVGVGNTLRGGVVAIIPAGFYLTIFLWLDRYDPEPPGTLCFAFVWGAVIAIFVSAIVNGIAFAAIGDTLTGIISAPLIEESSKGVGVLIIALFFRKDFDSLVDGIVYAGVVALGFATMENIDYYSKSFADGGLPGLIGTFFVRGILSPFSHVLFTCMTGIGYGIARETNDPAVKFLAPVFGLFGAMFLHALWNLLASFSSGAFFAGYFMLEMPMFAVFIALIFHLVRREGRILKRTLAAEVERGLITQHQLDIAISVFRRTGWVAAALFTPRLFKDRRRFLRSVAKLGLCHWHLERADEGRRHTDSFPVIRQLQARIFTLRDQVGH